jgi:hypothetical protein
MAVMEEIRYLHQLETLEVAQVAEVQVEGTCTLLI